MDSNDAVRMRPTRFSTQCVENLSPNFRPLLLQDVRPDAQADLPVEQRGTDALRPRLARRKNERTYFSKQCGRAGCAHGQFRCRSNERRLYWRFSRAALWLSLIASFSGCLRILFGHVTVTVVPQVLMYPECQYPECQR